MSTNSGDENSSLSLSNYQFRPWSSASHHRPPSASLTRDSNIDFSPLNLVNRSNQENSSQKRIIRHDVRIPTISRISSPISRNETNLTPEPQLIVEHRSLTSISSYSQQSIPIKIKANSFIVPKTKGKSLSNNSSLNFPQQIHRQRQITSERRKQKRDAQTLVEKYSENESWFQLRKSLAQLKHFARRENFPLDSTKSIFNGDGKIFSPLESNCSKDKRIVQSTRKTFSSSSTKIVQKPRENSSRLYFDPLSVSSKPIHRLSLSHSKSLNLRSKPKILPPKSSTISRSATKSPLNFSIFKTELPTEDNEKSLRIPSESQFSFGRTRSLTPNSTRGRTPSTSQLNLRKEMKTNRPRCQSANEIQSIEFSFKTSFPRFLIIADEEHRIESWFHHYSFLLAEDLRQIYWNKSSKSLLSVYFLDDFSHLSNSSFRPKSSRILQGTPFHVDHDWIKFDFILISQVYFEQLRPHLEQSMKFLKKTIRIFPIDHQEDLKKQVKRRLKAFQHEHFNQKNPFKFN